MTVGWHWDGSGMALGWQWDGSGTEVWVAARSWPEWDRSGIGLGSESDLSSVDPRPWWAGSARGLAGGHAMFRFAFHSAHRRQPRCDHAPPAAAQGDQEQLRPWHRPPPHPPSAPPPPPPPHLLRGLRPSLPSLAAQHCPSRPFHPFHPFRPFRPFRSRRGAAASGRPCWPASSRQRWPGTWGRDPPSSTRIPSWIPLGSRARAQEGGHVCPSRRHAACPARAGCGSGIVGWDPHPGVWGEDPHLGLWGGIRPRKTKE